MIKRRLLLRYLSSGDIAYQFRYLRCCLMAAPSNFSINQRDLTPSLRMFQSNATVFSSFDLSDRKLFNAFGLKGCCSENVSKILWKNNDYVNGNGMQKAIEFPHLLRASEVLRMEDQHKGVNNRGFNGVNGGADNCGTVTCFRDKYLPGRIMVAVDVDEVLGNFVSALNLFIADRYSLCCSISEYHVYEFCKIWNCTRDEADIRVHEFFKTSYFKDGIYPIPGAQKALQKLSESCNLSIVTSRQNAIKEHTIKWIEKHYPDLFQEFHFGNHFALDGHSRTKSEICKSLGANILIDDNPRYAIECAEVGIKVLLFDYENSYPWCKMKDVCQHPLVTKVHNWEEVENQLASYIVT